MTVTVVPRRRRVRLAGCAALASLVGYVLLGVPFLVLPPQQPVPAHADVVLVLGPPLPQRVAVADRLLSEGRVGTALVSVPFAPGTAEYAPWASCFAGRVAHTVCFRPDPSTTQGEARELGRLAAQRGWTSAVVTTQTSHLTRADLIVGRCFRGSITMRASGEPPSGGWPYQYLYQTAATLKAWFVTSTC